MNTETKIAEYKPIEAALAELNSKFKGLVFDVTKKEEMEAAKAARNEIRKYRTSLEAKRKEIKGPALEQCRLIDAEAARITAEISALEDPIAAQIDAEENRIAAEKAEQEAKERAAIEKIQAAINGIRQKPVELLSAGMAATDTALSELKALVVDDATFGIFREEAQLAKDAAIRELTTMLETKRLQEAEANRLKLEREELDKQKAAQAEVERQAREKIEANERESREKIEREEREARALREEEERKAREAREAAEAEERKKREAAEAEAREKQRKENLKLDGREMLTAFTRLYGKEAEFAEVTKAINKYFDSLEKAA